MAATAILAVVLSVTVALVGNALQVAVRGRVRGALARQGEFLNTVMRNELRVAGLGVPGARHIEDSYAGAGKTDFDTDVILATSTAVGVLADLPRPDAQYSTFGILHDNATGGTSQVMWHTENNGACATSYCDTKDTSIFFPGITGCTSNAFDQIDHRTCPWGLRRVVAKERIQVVSGAGKWTHAGVSNPLTSSTYTVTLPTGSVLPSGVSTFSVRYLSLTTSWNALWANMANTDPPVAVSGQGFVTTIDRLFYYLDSGRIYRIQCFGDPAPADPNWPSISVNTMPTLADLASVTPTGGTKNTCIGPEVMATNVASAAFTYYARDGTVATTKDTIRRIDWVITLQKTALNRTVQQHVVGTVSLRN